MGWSAGPGLRVVSHSADAVVPLTGPDGSIAGRWSRTAAAAVGCTATAVRTLTLAVTAGRGDDAVVHTSSVSVDCQEQGTISGLADTAEAGTGTVTVSDAFAVAPVWARCTASSTAGTATVAEGAGGERTLSVGLAVAPGSDASASVSVECTPPGHAPVTATATFAAAYGDRCDSPLGLLAGPVTSRSGTIAADAMCTSPQRTTSSAVYYALRHSFELANRAVVTIDLEETSSISTTLDTYVLLLEGSGGGGAGTVLGRNDDRVSGETDSRIADKTLAPGRYTIEATTYAARRTGRYTLTVTAQLEVLIEGLDGNSIIGTGTAVDYFTVIPAGATCTPSTGTVTDSGDGRRTLSVSLTALGDTEVTVDCSFAGYRTATAASTLTALTPVSDVSVDATAEGTCTKFSGTLDAGVDSKYTCTMTRGGRMTLRADATGPSAQMTLGWTAAVGVGVLDEAGDLDIWVVNDAVVFSQAGTGTVSCAAGGDIALTVSIDEVVQHSTVVSVTCVPPVEISNYVPGSRDGAGAMTGTFDVAPATATCTAAHAGGISGLPAAGGTGTSRTVSVITTATGVLDVEVECFNAGYGTSTVSAAFVARDESACVTSLGTAAHGNATSTGTIAQDIRCVSAQRRGGSGVFYARRHTFTLAASGWVTIGLDATGIGQDALDTYLLVLHGEGSGGTERGRDDDSGTGSNARLADVLLAAGTYTIEATTASNGATGGYRVTLGVDHDVRAPHQPVRSLATVGEQLTRSWAHQPATATVTVQSVTPEGLDASIVSDDGFATLTATPARAGDYTVTVAYTAAGHTSTKTTVIDADCPPRHIETDTRTCTPLATAIPAGCTVTPLHGWRIWGLREQSGQYLLYSQSADEDCDALSQSDKAAYYSFSLPQRLPVELELRDVISVATLRAGGAPSMTLWRVQSAHPVTGRVVGFEATASTTSSGGPFIGLDLPAGDYLIEIAPSRTVSPAFEENWYKLRTELPTAERTYSDVQSIGNTGLDGAGMTLGQFLDARGSLIYGAHPEADTSRATDPFYPESSNYPWLPFTSDGCSIPGATVPVVGDSILAAFNFKDRPIIDTVAVPFIYGCMRHDFNWRNLWNVEHRMGYMAGHVDGPWRTPTMHESNGRLGFDLRSLCEVDGSPEEPDAESVHFTWSIPRGGSTGDTFLTQCRRKADDIEDALGIYGTLAFGTLDYWDNY